MLNGSAQLVIEGGEFCLTTPYKKRLMSANRLPVTALCGPRLRLYGRQMMQLLIHLIQQRKDGFWREPLRCEQALSPADEVVGEVARDDGGDM